MRVAAFTGVIFCYAGLLQTKKLFVPPPAPLRVELRRAPPFSGVSSHPPAARGGAGARNWPVPLPLRAAAQRRAERGVLAGLVASVAAVALGCRAYSRASLEVAGKESRAFEGH